MHMRLVIQRVNFAEVENVDKKKVVGKIDKGLFVLVGVSRGDTDKEAVALAEKISKMRIMSDSQGKMNLSVKDVKSEVLVVSQFTLFADTGSGNRPSFIKSAEPEFAEKIYSKFVESLREQGVIVETGSFGDYMRIRAELDGPVTILI
jgi:D-aminoacyl-tRNA deacylase